MSFTLPDLIKDAERELKKREHDFPRLVSQGTLSQKAADRMIAMQQATIERLRELDAAERLL